MKVFLLTTAIIVGLIISSIVLQEQTSEAKLNQIELINQFLGSWKCDVDKDTTAFWNTKSYGTGLECEYNYVKMGK
jgi:hypothetical protein